MPSTIALNSSKNEKRLVIGKKVCMLFEPNRYKVLTQTFRYIYIVWYLLKPVSKYVFIKTKSCFALPFLVVGAALCGNDFTFNEAQCANLQFSIVH